MKINIAFTLIGGRDWIGGANYLKNLFLSVSSVKHEDIKIFLFVGKNNNLDLLFDVPKNIFIVKSKIFDKGSIFYFLRKSIKVFFRKDLVLINLLKKYDIQVLSHSPFLGKNLPFKVISWIPDFQHLYYKEMFSKKEIIRRNSYFKKIIKNSDLIILSSYDAFGDFKKFIKGYNNKVGVLPFVCKIDDAVYSEDTVEVVLKKYGINKRFFYLPNQFWKHKNHTVVFGAIKILRDRGINVELVCTGHKSNHGDSEYYEYLLKYIQKNKIEKNIKILGIIDYKEVLSLIRNSITTLNPSLFEGWSSTVEEVKSLGKTIILSDIGVHKEQCPEGGVYFSKDDKNELANIMEMFWKNGRMGPDYELEERARRSFDKRFNEFGQKYVKYVEDLFV